MRNLIVGSNVGTGVSIADLATRRVAVRNNYIGTNHAGTVKNASRLGVSITDSRNHVVERNVISASEVGVRVAGASFSNTLQGNLMGVGADGATPIGSIGDGVVVTDGGTANSPQNTLIGGLRAGQGNHIAYWGGNGVVVERASAAALPARFNSLLGNSVHDNGKLGIELVDTATNTGSGPNAANPVNVLVNGSQVFPVIASATASGQGTALQYSYAGVADSTLEAFASPVCNPSGYGEGQVFVARWTAPAGGPGPYTASLPAVPAGQWLTMTATAPNGDTSEFSQCMQAVAGNLPAGMPPFMAAVPDATVAPGSAWSLALPSYVTPTDGDPVLSYVLSGTLPQGLAFDAATGVLAGTPTALGAYTLGASATDKDGASVERSFTITVAVQGGGGPGGDPGGPGNGGGPTPVPALAPAGLGLLSALVAGVGALRRRKRGV